MIIRRDSIIIRLYIAFSRNRNPDDTNLKLNCTLTEGVTKILFSFNSPPGRGAGVGFKNNKSLLHHVVILSIDLTHPIIPSREGNPVGVNLKSG